MNSDKKFYLSEDEKMIAGVSGGLAKYLNVDVTLIRLAFVILALFDWLGLAIYIVLAIIAPSEKTLNEPSDVVENHSQDETGEPIVPEDIVFSEEEVDNEEDIVFSEEVEPTDEENTIVTEEDETTIEPLKGEKK